MVFCQSPKSPYPCRRLRVAWTGEIGRTSRVFRSCRATFSTMTLSEVPNGEKSNKRAGHQGRGTARLPHDEPVCPWHDDPAPRGTWGAGKLSPLHQASLEE